MCRRNDAQKGNDHEHGNHERTETEGESSEESGGGLLFLVATNPRLNSASFVLRSVTVPTPFESASLNLQLFDLRRETLLRQARHWFVSDFNPESFAEFVNIVSGEQNAWFRMVISYWDMAASLVSTGAIDGDAFRAAHTEIFATFSKIQPFLEELRKVSGESDICKHMEAVVMAEPNAEAMLTRRREAIRAAARARSSKSAHTEV